MMPNSTDTSANPHKKVLRGTYTAVSIPTSPPTTQSLSPNGDCQPPPPASTHRHITPSHGTLRGQYILTHLEKHLSSLPTPSITSPTTPTREPTRTTIEVLLSPSTIRETDPPTSPSSELADANPLSSWARFKGSLKSVLCDILDMSVGDELSEVGFYFHPEGSREASGGHEVSGDFVSGMAFWGVDFGGEAGNLASIL